VTTVKYALKLNIVEDSNYHTV